MRRLLGCVARSVLHAILPVRCLVCDEEDDPFAGRLEDGAVCARCRAAFPRAADLTCAACAASHDPPALPCAALYVATSRTLGLVHAMKYRGGTRLAVAGGRWLAEAWPQDWSRGDAVLVPIPLHLARARERGFNQSALLAQGLGEATGVCVLPRALRRTRRTRPQATLDDADRALNVRAAFAWEDPVDPGGCRVVLVDDVVTSGATVREAAGAVRAAGGRDVGVIALLRAIGHHAQSTCCAPGPMVACTVEAS